MNVGGRSVHWGFKVLGPTKRESSIESAVSPSSSISITVPWRKDVNVDLPTLSARLMATDDSLTRLLSLKHEKEQKGEKTSKRSSRLSVDYQPAAALQGKRSSSSTSTTTNAKPTGGGGGGGGGNCSIPLHVTTILTTSSSPHAGGEHPPTHACDSWENPSSGTLVASTSIPTGVRSSPATNASTPSAGSNVITKLFIGLSTRIRNSYRFSLSVRDAPPLNRPTNQPNAFTSNSHHLDATSSSSSNLYHNNNGPVASQRASIGLTAVHNGGGGGGQKRSSNLSASAPPASEQTHNTQTFPPHQGATPKSMTNAAAAAAAAVATSNPFPPEPDLSANSTAAINMQAPLALPQGIAVLPTTRPAAAPPTMKPAGARRTHGSASPQLKNNAPSSPQPNDNKKHSKKSVLLSHHTGYCAEDPLMKKPSNTAAGFNRRMSRAKTSDFTSFDVHSLATSLATAPTRKQSILLATTLPCPPRKSGNDLVDSQGRRLRTTKTMPFLPEMESKKEDEGKKDTSPSPSPKTKQDRSTE